MRFSLLAVLFSLIANIWALSFDVPAYFHPEPYCVRDFIAQGQLVVITILSDGRIGDGQLLSVYVRDSHNGNEYRRKKDFAGEIRITFEASSSTSFDVCFENVAVVKNGKLSRSVKLNIESGSEARDWNKIQAAQKLKPVEVELRRIEEMTDELVDQLNYLKVREERLRDTNESTNRRVRNFFVAVIFVFIGLGAWQLNYLKQYFRAKHII